MRSREKILDATLDLIEKSGFEAASIAAVSKAAGVSRQTVYSIFGSREEMVSQAIASIAVSTMTELYEKLDPNRSPTEYVTEMILLGRTSIRTHPILASLFRSEQGNPVFDDGVVDRTKNVVEQLMSPLTEQNTAVADDLDDILEIVTRLTLSLVFFESDAIRTDDRLRRLLHRTLSPLLP
ncbi:TetR/AcrR family transcriptional regulator [Rhodococcus sp. NPDC058521]|uniref:TetR/AcrR family transcriptional regulator n=1 Tax=Rhodococcus sp. NPDC058521 TaxID=3346536 RepID=UPI003651E9FA